QQFVDSQIGGDRHPRRRAANSKKSEELQRPRGIVQQKLHDHQIQKHANRAADSVIGSAIFAMRILDRHFRNFRAARPGQCRDETVQFAVQLDLLDDLASISFESRSEIIQEIQLTTRLGTCRVSQASLRWWRQPLTRSYPSSIFSTKRGISSGSCCRSPSIEIITSPRAKSNPALSAAVWPKFRRSRTMFTRRSCS